MNKKPVLFAIIAASLFGLSTPFAKLLIDDIHPVVLAGLFYLGAFAGLTLYWLVTQSILRIQGKAGEKPAAPMLTNGAPRIPSGHRDASLSARDIPWLSGAIISGGILAPICLMLGLTQTSGFTASLLLNLEAVATALIAVIIFRENAGKHIWLALISMTLAGIFLTWDSAAARFNPTGPVLIILAIICWGIDNNLTRHISDKNPVQISIIKGLVAGSISIIISLIIGAKITIDSNILLALLVGALGYGISLVLFIKALHKLGACRTGAFFSFGPFIGAIAALLMFNEWIGWVMLPGMILMIIGVRLITSENHLHSHSHSATCHFHPHIHNDIHHDHDHRPPQRGLALMADSDREHATHDHDDSHELSLERNDQCYESHAHEHIHNELEHDHQHLPDTHHRHNH